ncbi:MAG: HEAT repeat domain-containing protein [Planctomycetota bacterium]
MQMRTLAVATLTAAVIGGDPGLAAHGGTYRGPGDFVPPGQKSGSGKTGSPSGPSTPTPGTPSTPTPGNPPRTTGGGSSPLGPTNGPGRSGTPTTQGGYELGADLSRWEFWWELNKDPFLELKRRIHDSLPSTGPGDFVMGPGQRRNRASSLAPNATDKQQVLAVLKQLLADPDSNRDIVSSCLMAIAKVGGDTSVLPSFRAFLPDADQEKRETAALAMGITGLKEAVPDLTALALDDEQGRKLVGGRVDYRTRSFALYGLGLVAHANHDLDLQRQVLATAKTVLDAGDEVRRDEKVAALNALRLLALGGTSEGETATRLEVVGFLREFFHREKRETDLVRSHALTALAAQCRDDDPDRGAVLDDLVALVRDRHRKSWIHQSTVLALGRLARPEDAEACDALRRYQRDGKDATARGFAAISLGEVGGEANRAFLYGHLRAERTKDMDKPWLAFGLAVMDFRGRVAGPGHDPDRAGADAVLAELRGMRNRAFQAGLALALGIMRNLEAVPDIEAALRDTNEDGPKGYFCVALGLLGSHESKDLLVEVLDGAMRRDELLTQTSIALGLLGDKEVGRTLTKRLEQDNVVAVYSAIATSLGWIGDRYSISPLVRLAEDRAHKDLPRAFACVALGLVADKEPLPWNSKIAVGANYRASVETLSGSGTGILDIL